MNKHTKIIASVLSAMLIVTSFTGCGSSSSDTSTASGGKLPTGQTITVWSHLNEDETKLIKTKAEEWAKKTNNSVKVIRDNGSFQALSTAAKSSSGPDLVYGIPHDNLGQYVTADILSEIPSGTIDDSSYVQTALDACKYNGKTYAVPVAAETYAIAYNKDLVKDSELPKTWDELVTLGKKVGFEMDITNFYFTYSILAGNGAYIFKASNGKYDTTNIGLGGAQATAGYKMVKDLIDQGLMKPSVTTDIAKGDFTSKKIGLFMTGPWDITGNNGFKTLGMNFGTFKLPTINGQATPSLMTVQMALVMKNTKNKDLSFDLLKYLQTNALNDLYAQGRLPVTKSGKVSDPTLQGFADQIKNAQATPNIPEMSTVWTPSQNTLRSLVTGKLKPEDAGKNMVDNINKGIATLK